MKRLGELIGSDAGLVPRRVMMSRLSVVMTTGALAGGMVTACSNPPEKPPGYVEVMPSGIRDVGRSFGRAVPKNKGLLAGPNFGVLADEVAAVESTSDLDDALKIEQPFRAAEGDELLLLGLGFTELAEGRWDERKAPAPTVAVVVNGRATKLKEIPKQDSLIVASVPKGRPARLSVTDQGRTQSLDMRTGTRAADAVDFSHIPAQQLNVNYRNSGQVTGHGVRRELDVRIDVSDVTLEPYLPSRGWAKPGRAWLALDILALSTDGTTSLNPLDPGVGFFMDPAKTFRLSWTGGSGARALGRPVAVNLGTSVGSPSGPRYRAIFDVPSSFQVGDLTIAPDGTLFTIRGTSSTAEWENPSRVPDCSTAGRIACLSWQRIPKPQILKLALR